MTDAIEELATEVKGAYDLRARLQNRAMRTAIVTVFTDEVLGEQHLKIAEEVKQIEALLVPIPGVTLSEIVVSEADAEVVKLNKQLEPLTTELNETSMTFNLRAVPKIVSKDAARRARKSLGIKGKINDDQFEDYAEYFNSYMLTKVVASYTDHAIEQSFDELTLDGARALEELLPDPEYARLKAAMDDLIVKNAFSETITGQVDF